MGDEKMSVFCKIYQNMSQNLINRISKNCNYKHYHWPLYKRAFLTDNPQSTVEDWYVWKERFQTHNWEIDIWTMTMDDFEYHWPYHSAFIRNSFEGANLFEEE